MGEPFRLTRRSSAITHSRPIPMHSLYDRDTRFTRWTLFQFAVLCFSLGQNGDVLVGIFPKREEIFIRRPGLPGIALRVPCAGQLKSRQCSDRVCNDDAWMIQYLLKLERRLPALLFRQVCFATQVY